MIGNIYVYKYSITQVKVPMVKRYGQNKRLLTPDATLCHINEMRQPHSVEQIHSTAFKRWWPIVFQRRTCASGNKAIKRTIINQNLWRHMASLGLDYTERNDLLSWFSMLPPSLSQNDINRMLLARNGLHQKEIRVKTSHFHSGLSNKMYQTASNIATWNLTIFFRKYQIADLYVIPFRLIEMM